MSRDHDQRRMDFTVLVRNGRSRLEVYEGVCDSMRMLVRKTYKATNVHESIPLGISVFTEKGEIVNTSSIVYRRESIGTSGFM